MKLHLNNTVGLNVITGHGDSSVSVNNQPIHHALIVMPDKIIDPWQVADLAGLLLVDFSYLLESKPELVIFGSGKTFRFPDSRIMSAFAQARVGFEVMNTAAACRTYNVLAGEGRNVAAALLV